ncbi:MAG: hypothetical protein ABSH06_02635 [Thermodesulfobacteriota bacterium]
MIEEEKECPWCGELLSLAESNHQGSRGKMRIMRCGKCHKLISARLEGEPDRIIKKELIEGGSS